MFDLDPRSRLTVVAIRNVLTGNRADGEIPRTEAGKALRSEVIEGAQKRFKAALGLAVHRQATAEEMAHLEVGRMATGCLIDAADDRRQILPCHTAAGRVRRWLLFLQEPVRGLCAGPHRGGAAAPALLDIHKHAVADTMAYIEERLGSIRKGAGGGDGVEPAKLGMGQRSALHRPANG